MVRTMENQKIKEIINFFQKKYPKPRTKLKFNSPFELLVATILSAQTTDKQVNKVTDQLFARYYKPEDFSKLKADELQEKIKSIGLHHSKSKYIIESSKMILQVFNGQLPQKREELMRLPGVGRKTANVVLASAFNKTVIAVDTHVFRVANRLGIVKAANVKQTEKQLMAVVPEELRVDIHHWFIFHGRSTCKARKPDCQNCMISKYCDHYQNVVSTD